MPNHIQFEYEYTTWTKQEIISTAGKGMEPIISNIIIWGMGSRSSKLKRRTYFLFRFLGMRSAFQQSPRPMRPLFVCHCLVNLSRFSNKKSLPMQRNSIIAEMEAKRNEWMFTWLASFEHCQAPAATITTTTPLTTIWKINNSNSNNICKSCLLEQHLAGNQTTLVLNSAKFPQKAATRQQLDNNCNGKWMNWDANWDVSWDVSCDGSSRIIIPNNNVKFQQQRMAPNTIVVRHCCRGCQLLGSWRCCCSCKLKCIEFPIKNVLQIKKSAKRRTVMKTKYHKRNVYQRKK